MNHGAYEIVSVGRLVGLLCRRCPTVLLTANEDGSQSDLTLADICQQADDHEAEVHQ